MKIGLDTESCHLLFHFGKIDIFGFIRKTAELGLDGVMINLISLPGDTKYIHPKWGCLGGDGPAYLERVKQELKKYSLYAEVVTRGIDPDHLSEAVGIAKGIGADLLRTYCCFGKYDPASLAKAPENFRKIVPLLVKNRIKLAVENHEEETADEIIDIVKKVGRPWVGVHCDIGNPVMAWEDPASAVAKMAPWAITSHFKDLVVIPEGNDYRICGVPLGRGNIDIEECFRILVEKSTLTRINIELSYPFLSVFKRDKGTGGISELGKGAFKIEKPVFRYDIHTPMEYYYPPEEYLEEMIELQQQGLTDSIRYMKKLRDKYCS